MIFDPGFIGRLPGRNLCVGPNPQSVQHFRDAWPNTRNRREVVATVRNLGAAEATCEVTVDVDGGEPTRKVIKVPAGAEGEADFQITFRTPGKRRVRAALSQDALAADDQRFLTVEVRDRIRILLVDGRDGGDPLKSYAYLWQCKNRWL